MSKQANIVGYRWLAAGLLGLAALLPVPAALAADVGTPAGETATPVDVPVGKSTLLRTPDAVARLSVGNPLVVDAIVISPREVYLLGKKVGSTNVIVWTKGGSTLIADVTVGVDAAALERKLAQLMPNEKYIRTSIAADSVVLSGSVTDAAKARQAVAIAEAFVRNLTSSVSIPVSMDNGGGAGLRGLSMQSGGGMTDSESGTLGNNKIINLLQVLTPQQVILEVKVAEVSKVVLDKFGIGYEGSTLTSSGTGPGGATSFVKEEVRSVVNPGSGVVLGSRPDLKGVANIDLEQLTIEAQKQDGLVKILAEPNIVALSGQEASFLAGGRIFIPIVTSSAAGSAVSLDEKEFGIGVKFTPTVLDNGRINLVIAPEVSELSQAGSSFTTVNGSTTVLPSISTRRVTTTVQLSDGQSLAVAGLMKNNVKEVIKAFPILGEIPILGALFRSSEFQNEQTELLFVITPRLINPVNERIGLPTDAFEPPSRAAFMLGGRLEGSHDDDDDKKKDRKEQQDQKDAAKAP